jgi:hypothetical protein
MHLLCFEVGPGAALVFPAVTGKRAFITSAAVAGNFGSLAAGDGLCQSAATGAGLSNPTSFKAWLSTSTIGAASRFVSNGPWVRLDGVRIASSKADLIDGRLATTINLTETGHYLVGAQAWTATIYNGTAAGANCKDWFGGVGYGGYTGVANDAHKWTLGGSATCDTTSQHLYCLED